MPRGSTKFSKSWLEQTDSNGHLIKEWCREKTEISAECILCKKIFNIQNGGLYQVTQHASGKKHQSLANTMLDKSQTRFVVHNNNEDQEVSLPKSKRPVLCLTESDMVSQAEIYWCLHVAAHGYSFNSCDNIASLFKNMFPNSLADKVTLGREKVSYSIAYGIGPYFQSELVKSISDSHYVISMDEATTDSSKKQLDFHIRFWDKITNTVVSNFLFAVEMGHATALIQKDKLLQVLEKNQLDIKKLLMIGSDGPAVNIKLLKDVNSHVKSIGHMGLVEVGTCNLHVIHNSFGKGLKIVTDWKIEELLDLLHKWFHRYPSRKEDFAGISEDGLEVLRYVSNRWLSMVPVIERTLKLYKSLQTYFLEYVPTSMKQAVKTYMYPRIKEIISDQSTVARLRFLVAIGQDFRPTMALLQRTSPLIHILYDQLVSLVKCLMGRMCVPQYVSTMHGVSLDADDFNKPEHRLPLNKVDLGVATAEHVNKLKEIDRLAFRHDCIKFLEVVIKYMIVKLPLKNKLLKNLQCLHPVMQTEECSTMMIVKVGKAMPNVISTEKLDDVKREWRLYMCETLDENAKSVPVDTYWANILKEKSILNEPKYPTLKLLIEPALTLSHGQADVERGFSLNKTNVTSQRSLLSFKSINALRHIQDVKNKFTEVSKIPITPGLLKSFRQAHSVMAADQEKIRLKRKVDEEETSRKRTKAERESQKLLLIQREKEVQKTIARGQKLMSEGNSRLTKATRGSTMDKNEICAAQGILATAESCISEGTKELSKVQRDLELFNKK